MIDKSAEEGRALNNLGLSADRVEKFKSIVKSVKGNFLILITQIDPDALGAAYAFQAVLSNLKASDSRIKLYWCGQPGMAQNRAIVNLGSLSQHFNMVDKMSVGKNDILILIDSSATNDSRIPESLRPLRPVMVFDHHDGDVASQEEGEDQFFCIDNEVGSASTLIEELAVATDTELTEYRPLFLAFGIYNDTKQLASSSRRDRESYGRLTEKANQQELQMLINFPLSENYFDSLQYALNHRKQKGGRIVMNAGQLKEDSGDDLSVIADLMLRQKGVDLAVVWGMIGQKVRISARSSDLGTLLGDELRKKFSSGGAKLTPSLTSEGGVTINIDFGIWWSEGVREHAEKLVSERINELIFE